MDKNTPETFGQQALSWLDSTAAKLVGAGGAIAATLFTARIAISNAFFNTMNKGEKGAFKDLQLERDSARAAATEAAKHSLVPDAMERVAEINKDYQIKYEQRRRNLGIRKGIMGIYDETKALKYHQWVEVGFATAAVASVAIGAIFAIASNREVAQKQKELEDKQEQSTNGVGR